MDGTGPGSCPMAGFGSSVVRSLCELPVVKHEEVQCCMWCTNSAVFGGITVHLTLLYVVPNSAVCGALTLLYVVHNLCCTWCTNSAVFGAIKVYLTLLYVMH